MKKILLILSIVFVLATFVYLYLYKSHRDISSEQAIIVNGLNVIKEFENNEDQSNKKYLDKTIEIQGNVTSIDEETKTVILDEKIFTSFNNNEGVKIKTKISIKGRLIGYDSLLGEIKLDQCSLVK